MFTLEFLYYAQWEYKTLNIPNVKIKNKKMATEIKLYILSGSLVLYKYQSSVNKHVSHVESGHTPRNDNMAA